MTNIAEYYFLFLIAIKTPSSFVNAGQLRSQSHATDIATQEASVPKEEVSVRKLSDTDKGYMLFKHICDYRKKNTDYKFVVNILNPGNNDITCVFSGLLETPTKGETSCNGDPNAVKGCGNFCRRCSTHYSIMKMPCPKMCYVDGCDCKQGYILDDYTGKCVLPQQCSLII